MKSYLVAGLGISGIAAAKLLKDKGCQVVLYDGNPDFDKLEFKKKNNALEDCEIFCGEFPNELLGQVDVCVLSPGVPVDLSFVEQLRSHGTEISGEIELAYSFGKGTVVAITGTNGKTTTTSLVGEIIARAFKDTRVVGNIGIPYTSVAGDTTDDTVLAVEISSFQLETIHSFAPHVSAILNITPDHLDRHHTMDAYIKAKEAIATNQKAGDYCVLNADDPVLYEFGRKLSCKVVYFSSKKSLDSGVYYADGAIWYSDNNEVQKVIDVKELQILGVHNYENAAASTAICLALGISMDIIREGLREFVAVAHRIEFICEKDGVRYYNDSKGTNPDAAIKAVEAMERPTILIGGGYDKNASYDEWIESFDNKVKLLVLIGETKQKIADCARKHDFLAIKIADTLEEAVRICHDNSVSGDAVLLSPACASWDMFKNYEERGRIFSDLARSL